VPELGRMSRKQVAAPVGVAPYTFESDSGVIKHIDSHRQRHPVERRGTETVLAVQQMAMGEVSQLIAGARGAITGLMAEIIEDHIRVHLFDPAHAASELINVVRAYLK
jgi:hypothetical protein